jgi:hypothetical protein
MMQYGMDSGRKNIRYTLFFSSAWLNLPVYTN